MSSQYSSLLLYDYHYFLMTLAFSVYSQYLYPQIIQLNQCLNFHLIDTNTNLPGVSIAIMYDEILLLFEHVCLKLIDWSFNPYLSSDQIENRWKFSPQ